MSDELEMLKECVRSVTESDKDLPVFSHSKLETYINCPYQYNLKYEQKKTTTDTTIALQCGSLAHKCLELKGQMIQSEQPINYMYLFNILDKGYPEEKIAGKKEIMQLYWDSFNEKDSENRTYTDKFNIFENVLKTEMNDMDGWEPYLFEHEFEFVYKNRIKIMGFIDRIDKKGDEYRLIDYKTSKKVYDDSKLRTSPQFAIYNFALWNEFGVLASDNIYRFIFIDDEQHALSKGWLKRYIDKLDKTLNQLNENKLKDIYPPHPTPLCHFCQFCMTNPDATIYKHECPYYMKWTRNNKDFSVNKEWNPEIVNKPKRTFDW